MAEKKKQTYAEAIAELEAIVSKLQNNECEIDELKNYTTRSLTLLRFCKEKLFETDKEVKKILEELGD
ncbi:exodeoxyribonuclease VII small subunit [Coprobacter secundus]|jgi:exonuclease VII small subunit|uniref:exodeoxyribonuclease VII small subunit n=1 Tax=Coprobacter secundus TaxID=1501392 RepID=UPI00057423B4|nr:exodeoxyribonuclease VII small subunit [Coprobacter secundus]KHM49034.1 exodeoxyribonuclease VII [Coprobacter secundus]